MKTLTNTLETPLYSSAEVSRLVGIHPQRVRRWLQGYQYKYESKRREIKPVVRRLRSEKSSYASFLELVDLIFVNRFLKHNISLQKLRKALDEATRLLHTNHFARKSFFTDGRNIYLRLREAEDDQGEAILKLLTGGQWVIPDVITQLAHQIDFDEATELARRWYPEGYDRMIVLDPDVSFGRPCIRDKGVATATIYDLYLAEGRSVRSVARWMQLKNTDIEVAVHFEHDRLKAAA